MKERKRRSALLSGVLGCICFGSGDWLMMYGDPAFSGKLKWLTAGTAAIPQWRYMLAMVLAFPGIIFYGASLFTLQDHITDDRKKKIYHYLNAFGLTPWIALHLIYVVILSLFAWLNNNGYAADALVICESLFDGFSWLIPLCEAFMLPVFIYWFYLQITGNTLYKKGMAFTNVLFIFAALKGISMLMPESGFKLAFTNGLMSESMIIWFLLMYNAISTKI
ncbi:MAG: hypothetical protein K6G12_09875 [Lachnospiraceae bacterium]|nr:hypothetical protein [Lachnospiraceae bacterium]